MNAAKRRSTGFTLLEMILVLVIMSSIILLITNYGSQRMDQFRRDKTALQMQQILSAGLSYYVSNGTWPTTCGTSASLGGSNVLQTAGYLPAKILSPFVGNSYSINCNNTTGTFSVSITTFSARDALVIAGQLPMTSVNGNSVTAQVLVPGQNLNNARSINFANVYHTGACVPVPACPSGMSPQIFAVPAGISGVNDNPGTGTPVTYPISSFMAYATPSASVTANSGPAACDGGDNKQCYSDASGTTWSSPLSSGDYWRVCLYVMTEKGPVTIPHSNNPSDYRNWAQALGKIYVTTRCVPTAEPSGSKFNVWGPTS